MQPWASNSALNHMSLIKILIYLYADMSKILLKLLKCRRKVPGCKQRAGHTKAQQRGLPGQECYKWLSCNRDLSVAVLPHVFPRFWISLSKEITEFFSCMSTVLAWPQPHWPPLVAGPSPTASCLLWHKTDISKEYSSFTGVENCCCSDFLVTGLLHTQGLWKRALNMPFS